LHIRPSRAALLSQSPFQNHRTYCRSRGSSGSSGRKEEENSFAQQTTSKDQRTPVPQNIRCQPIEEEKKDRRAKMSKAELVKAGIEIGEVTSRLMLDASIKQA
jgi:hypothetical protein